MPGKIKVKVLAGRNLPVMDRAGDTTDAFVEIKFGGVTHKTDVCRKSLNPQWNSTEWYRFEVDESELQDEPLQLRLMDHDTYSANDAIGKVVISLAPLLAREANNAKAPAPVQGGAVMSGWIPVFDTMHGIRGELNVIVKVELFSDFNKYKTSSCGVQFFHCPMIPPGYRATAIHGFVEELVVNDDPEYQWIDKIRTPRASNEARQVAFIKLSNQVQRLVGLKAAELGANAVVGYQQDFDLEGEAGVVARAIGTAVSITPLPTPSQSSNVPPCTQQQLKKYLDILATDDERITDLNQYYQTHQEELQKLLTILNPKTPSLLDETDNVDEDEKSILTRQSSIKSYAGTVSIYQDDYISQKSLRHIADDQTELNRLLCRADDDEESQGPLRKIKKFKTSFFLKKLGNMRSSRKSEASKQDDTISLKSNSSDTSRISVVDLKNEIKKFKRMKKPKFQKTFTNEADEGVGMASILARSVMHAHTSLACIAETQDTDPSPNSTLRRTSESEPTINIDDEKNSGIKTAFSDSSVDTDITVPEIRFTSLKNISTEGTEPPQKPERQRKLSESCPTTPVASRNDNFLKLPGEMGYFGSVSSALSDSSEIYTSSEEDDESSDQRTDTDKSLETTSAVVRYLMNNEVNPALIAQMDKKLSIMEVSSVDKLNLAHKNQEELVESSTSISNSSNVEAKSPDVDNNKNENIEKDAATDQVLPSTSIEADNATFVASKRHSHQFKFHNPFAHKKSHSVSAPSSPVESKSFVYRSSKRIKRQLSKLSKSSMIKSLSHYSLIPKKKAEPKTAMSQPGSGSDIISKAPSETVLGSPFLSYADLLSLDKEDAERNKVHQSDEFGRSKVSMYIGSEPVSRASLSGSLYPDFALERRHSEIHHKKEKPSLKSTGLLHTAMETILIDKVQSLLIPTSPEPADVNRSFFDDVTEKLEKVEEAKLRKSESTGLVHTAMETILMDKVQSLLTPATPGSSPTNNFFHEEMNKKSTVFKPDTDSSNEDRKSYTSDPGSHKKTKRMRNSDSESSGLVHTAMETILMDKVQSLFTSPLSFNDPPDHAEKKVSNEHDSRMSARSEPETTGLINTAMKTILMDKVQDLVDPNAIEIENPREGVRIVGEIKKNQDSSEKSSGLINTAVQTILMDKVQSLIDPNTIDIEEPKENVKIVGELKKNHEPSVHSSGLIGTAMKTILIDKVQSLIDPNALEITERDENVKVVGEVEKTHGATGHSPGLIDTAMKTILIDKVQSLIDPNALKIREQEENVRIVGEVKKDKETTDHSPGLIDTAVKTMLIDKVQSLIDPTAIEIMEPKENVKIVGEVKKSEDSGNTSGLINTAVKTILMDKVQSLIDPSTVEIDNTNNVTDTNEEKIEPESSGLINTAVKTILMDKVQYLIDPDAKIEDSKKSVIDIEKETNNGKSDDVTHSFKESALVEKVQSTFHSKKDEKAKDDRAPQSSGLIKTAMETMLAEKAQALLPTAEANTSRDSSKPKLESRDSSKDKRLVRQNSVHSDGDEPLKMSNVDRNPKKPVTPVLQHFHPILSGAQLETIPSLPESFDRTESLDVEGVGREDMCDTNSASVCGNSHAACGVGRCERDRDREREKEREKGSPRHARHESYGGREPVVATSHTQNSSLNSSSTPMGIHRRSSDSDLSVTPKGSSLNASGVNTGSGGGAILRPSMNSNNLEMLEYPFLTMTEYPPGFIVHIGGTVCARSVKLVDGGGESAARAAWWAELRTELRAHARALRCNAVIAYNDTAAICEDVCVLSASGTAAVINLDCDINAELDAANSVSNGTRGTIEEVEAECCSAAHVPYSPGAGPYRAELSVCGGCRRARVPAVLLATCSKPSRLASFPKAVTLTAVAARTRRAPPASEPGARDISDQLPFLEYELHKLLLAKLRMQGANALFNLQTQIAIGERCVMALASGTAVRLTALPPPAPPRIKASENDKEALEIQKALWDSFTANKAANGYDTGPEHSSNGALPELEGEAPPQLDLCADKDACVLELDEAEDVETARSLARRGLHARMPVYCSALTPLRAAPPYAFVQVWRGKVVGNTTQGGIRGACERQVGKALDALAYKLRRLQPAALLTTSFRLDLPEDEVQLVVSGAAIRLRDPNKPEPEAPAHGNGNHGNGTGDADDDIFALDEDQLVKSQHSEPAEEKPPAAINGQSPSTVALSSVCQVSGARWARRLCALRLLFVRETTSVRELGGLSGFLHTFTSEVLAIVRAYTAALGGNALTSFYITQLMLQDNAHKNQGQCLLSVGGDVVHITY